jgi:hypothetical protein
MRKKIETSNYEEWFMDHLDGTLNQQEIESLQSFLALNPELKEELESMSSFQLQATESIALSHDVKASLKKEELEDEFIISLMESGNSISTSLSSKDRVLLSSYEKTILEADSKILFPDHESLKKKDGIIIPLWFKVTAAAASLFFAFLLLSPTDVERSYQARGPEQIKWDNAVENTTEPIQYASEENTKAPVESAEIKEKPLIVQEKLIPKKESNPLVKKEKDSLKYKAPVPLVQEEKILTQELPEETPLQVIDEHLLVQEIPTVKSPPHHVPVSSSLKDEKTISSALDLLKKVTANSEVLAIQEINERDPYIEGSLSLGSFSLSIKRKRK